MTTELTQYFNVSVAGDHMTMRIDAGTPWSHDNMYRVLKCYLEAGVSYILLDKRAHITAANTRYPEQTIDLLGKLLLRSHAKLAAVLNDEDHLEKIVCFGVMRSGGRVLSTPSMEEAVFWLGGAIN